MGEHSSTVRIDQLLLWEGLVTERAIKDALKYQKEYGGKIGSHLMRLGHVSEEGLVRALAKQHNSDGVVLGNIEIPDAVIGLLPAKVVRARLVVPFDFVSEENLLKVACEDPGLAELADELRFITSGKDVRLYIAAELALKSSIMKYYPLAPETDQSGPMSVANESASAGMEIDPQTGGVVARPSRGTMLIVTDEPELDQPLTQALANDNYSVELVDSADAAIDRVSQDVYKTVFVRDSVQGDYIDLIDRVRKRSPGTLVRYYESAGRLLTTEMPMETADSAVKNLELFTSLLASKDNQPNNHAGTVGMYSDKLCRRLDIPAKERLMIVTAAYLHDLAKTYYGTTDVTDDREVVKLTVKLLDSLNFSPLLVGILSKMYINLHGKYTKRLPIEALGGNIVTICDIFCTNMSTEKKISLDRFEVLRQKFVDLTGKLFLTEVVEAFVDMIQDDLLEVPPRGRFNQVMLYCADDADAVSFEQRLRKEGFRVVAQSSLDRFVELCHRGEPDMMILVQKGEPPQVNELIDTINNEQLINDGLPVFLLVDAWVTQHLTTIFERGIEDLLPIDQNLELLVAKMKKVQARLESRAPSEDYHETTGAVGSIENMNLIDLLQAMGPGRKTARLVVSQDQRELEMYLHEGQIVYARLGELTGPDAVYEGISWASGHWTTQPVDASAIPEPNNDLPNESLLMEGCRLLDEKGHQGA